jgi:hypothetical protein
MTSGPRTLFGSRVGIEQTVFTPESILRVVRDLWGGTIAYDPCHGHPGQVLTKAGRDAVANETKDRGVVTSRILVDDDLARIARRWIPRCPRTCVDMDLAVDVRSLVNATAWTDCDGLTAPWPDGTFANPPYDKLKDWLAWSLEQNTDHVMLVPVRPHRKWWREWARKCGELVYLNPVTFEGHSQSFPAPLCLARRVTSQSYNPLGDLCKAAGIGESI